MRPKSMATVVVFFVRGARRGRRRPSDASVTIASVRSGMISETAPTNVVLPAPNPPETTIFVEAAARARRGVPSRHAASQSALRPRSVLPISSRRSSFVAELVERGVHLQVTLCHQVTDQHPSHTERQSQLRRDLGDRREIDTHCENLTPHIVSGPPRRGFADGSFPIGASSGRCDPRLGAAGRQRVRPDQTRFVRDLPFPQRSSRSRRASRSGWSIGRSRMLRRTPP